ncbi:MAG TPA: thioredoxin family protein [Thermoanaerobaculaceae bacterium]|nr:thioredoxin family protein [Thermoanaerobaculaceae bacterium]HRS15344.1 thioredoxin family protein [Thermoanaerobaculaceae bacterium]
MKKVLAALVATGLAGVAAALGLGESIPMGDVKMKNVDGREVSIASVKGARGTLVVFTCNHCPYVKAWEGRLTMLGNAAPEMGIGAIFINSNDPQKYPEDSYENMQARAAKLGLKIPYVVDATSDVARAFGAGKTPEVFLFDAAGKLVYHGTVDDNSEKPDEVTKLYLKEALSAVAEGRVPAVQETKALGCSIKFRPKA